jgi:cell division septation protein DedD/predicted Ser/Thr protein kinase
MTIVRDDPATRRAENSQWFGKVGVEGTSPRFLSDESACLARPSSIPDRYQILAQVGTGGTGVVYKVRCLETGEIVALKVLKPGIASDPGQQDNLRKEMCLARKITHKNVCRIHEFSRSNGMAYLSMEFVEGETLLSKLRRGGRLSIHESLEIARQICAGLREAHLQGIVHRDLKPANIMLEQSGVVKIMDFGIAHLSQGNAQITGTIAGTPAYMAPEQVELKPISPRTDVYSVGLLIYEMLTGSKAFEGDTPIAIALKQIRKLPRRPREIVPTLPAYTEAVILKCLQKDPARRFQSVDELYTALATDGINGVSVPGCFSLKVRVPHLSANRVIQYGTEKARGAALRGAAFVVEVRQASLEANRFIGQGVKKFSAFVRAPDPQAAKITRMGSMFAALGIVLLGTVVAFGLETGSKSHTREVTERSVGLPPQSPQLFDSKSVPFISPPDAGPPSTTDDVELIRGSELALGDEAPGTASVEELSPPHDASGSIDKAGVQASSEISISSTARTNLVQGKTRYRPRHPLTTPLATRDSADNINVEKIADVKKVLPSTVPQTSSPEPTPKPTDMPNQQKENESKSDLTRHYLEVGSFKDSIWAQKAVDQLAGLGFHAVSIHKGRLWMQSYHVQVGPYANQTDIEAAQRSLASHDFASHLAHLR